MDKWIIIHPTHLLPNPFMTQPAHLPPLVVTKKNLGFWSVNTYRTSIILTSKKAVAMSY